MIDTDHEFNVKTEFMSTGDYKHMWGIRTTLSQKGRYLKMVADCSDYMGDLGDYVSAGMGMLISSWDNRDRDETFELYQGQAKSDTCDNSKTIIKNFATQTWGSNRARPAPGPEPEPKPDPAPKPDPRPEPGPANFEKFYAESEYVRQRHFYAKGLDSRYLDTEGASIFMGEENRSWLY